jgi:hypothetical protein
MESPDIRPRSQSTLQKRPPPSCDRGIGGDDEGVGHAQPAGGLECPVMVENVMGAVA